MGKRFHQSKFGNARGENCFIAKLNGNLLQQIEEDHSFDICKASSKIVPAKQAFVLTYAPYHPRLSLWHSMRDEMLVVRRPETRNGKGTVFLGLGSMGWSGGYLNCSPFCLWIP